MDKNKIIEAATKYSQAGKYDKAIKEYQKILDEDPKDSRVLQKVGELHQRKGDNAAAAECFLSVAEIYATDGFALKAVAVYKNVLKLDEKRIDVNLKLAELYQQLGLMSEAMGQLQLVSAHYEKTGDNKGNLDLLKRMVELDPDNVASRIKLAEQYARDNLNAEAVSEFQKAAGYLKRNNRVDDYIKVAERLLYLDPSNVELSRELAQIYLARQDTKRALAKLQICFKSDPRDIETLTLLAQAFLDLGQASKTISVYKELAKIYEEQSKTGDERGVWEKVQQLAPDDPDAARRMAEMSSGGAPATTAPTADRSRRNSVGPGGLKPVDAGPLPPDQIAKLLTETDVYVKYGLQDKALEHLKKIFASDPDNVEANDKSYQIALAAGKHAEAEDKLIHVIRLATAAGDMARARARFQTLLESNPGHPAVSEFLQSIGNPAQAQVEEHVEAVDDSILIDSVDDAEVVEEAPVEDGVEVTEFGPLNEESASGTLMVDESQLIGMGADEVSEMLASQNDEPLALGDDEALEVTGDEPLGLDDVAVVSDEPLVVAESDDEALVAATHEASTLAGDSTVDDLLVAGGEISADEVITGRSHNSATYGDEFDLDSPNGSRGATDEHVPFSEPPTATDLGAGRAPTRSAQTTQPAGQPARTDRRFVPTNVHPSDDDPPVTARGIPFSLDDDDEPTLLNNRRPENDNEGATRVVNLAQLARDQGLNSNPKMPAAPKANELKRPLSKAEADDIATVARVPIARNLGTQPQPKSSPGKVSTKGSLPTAPSNSNSNRPPPTGTSPTLQAAPSESLLRSITPPATAPEPEEDPATEELAEAEFLVKQGGAEELETAKEILETVMIAYPGNARAGELMAQLEARQAQLSASPEGNTEDTGPSDTSFDLAAELADELGDIGGGEAAPLSSGDGFQISAEDVFAEFKKGVSKVVKAGDVDTHYDLGNAYKEMGLLPDAIGEFEQAMAGAGGKPREIDCYAMIANCRQLQGDAAGAIVAYRAGLALSQITSDQTKALQFELALAYEADGQTGRALAYFLKVAKSDPRFRDAQAQADRLKSDGVSPEDDEPAPARRGANGVNGVHANGVNGAHGSGSNGAAQKSGSTSGAEPSTPGKPTRKIGYV